MSLSALDFPGRNASRKFSLSNRIMLLGLLLLLAIFTPRPVVAVGPTACTPTPGFQVEASLNYFVLLRSATASSTITVTPKNGFTGTVMLSVINTNPDITNPALSTTSLSITTGPQTSTLTFGTSSTISVGSYTLEIDATNGVISEHTPITVRVPAPSIELSADKYEITLQQGEYSYTQVSVRSVYGFAGTVALTTRITPLIFQAHTPPSATISPASVTLSSGNTLPATLTITSDAAATPGIYSVEVTGNSVTPAATGHTALLLTVQGADFEIGAKPSLTVPLGSSGTATLNVNSTMGFAGTVTLTTSFTLPYGTPPTVSLAASIVLAAGDHKTLPITFNAGGSTTAGFYLANITGTSGLLSRWALITINVEAPQPGFSLTPDHDTLTINTGDPSTSTTITVASNNLVDTIDLSIYCSTDEITASISPASVTFTSAGDTRTATLTVSASQYTTPGSYLISIHGSGAASFVDNSTSVRVTVNGPDFDIISNPATLSIAQGSSATSTISVAGLRGFTDNVALSIEPMLGSGFTTSLSTATISPSSTSTLTVHVANTIGPGTYLTIVTGTSGSLTHSVHVVIQVTSSTRQPDFDLTANPTSLSINQGDKGTTTITVTPKYGFTGNVALSASPSTAGLTATFSPSSVSYGSGSSTMTINAGSSVPVGTYIVTVQGSSGSSSHPIQVTISVTTPQSQQQTSSNPQTILGLAPIMFYSLAGGITVVVIGGIGVALRLRKPKPL